MGGTVVPAEFFAQYFKWVEEKRDNLMVLIR
jgi:hypothetical protein